MFHRTCNVLMLFPRFVVPSMFSFKRACQVVGKYHTCPPLGLMTVAALLPPLWQVRLIDRNVTEVTDKDFAWADLVMTGGMIPQRPDNLEVIAASHEHGKPVVVGGPDVTSSSELYEDADYRFLGEAEGTIEQLVDMWSSGTKRGTIEAEKYKADVTTTPVPRFDLVNLDHYIYVGLQFSRGCPFTCEFCDIIELFGRVPRTKTVPQMMAELDALYAAGYRGHVDFVDDNLIGNKKAVKAFLPQLIAWQRKKGFPFAFSTQASLNIADDDALLGMMREANFFGMFIGIESPNSDTLASTLKKQNTRRDIAASIRKIYAAGLYVSAGFIIGFDNETATVADEIVDLIEEARIPVCSVSLLAALPSTGLWRRLEAERRLRHDMHMAAFAQGAGETFQFSLNFATARPRRDILVDFKRVFERIYDPVAFFARLRALSDELRRAPPKAKFNPRMALYSLRVFVRMLWWINVRHPEMRRPFWSTFVYCLMRHPRNVPEVATTTLGYLHIGPFARETIENLEREIAAIDASEAAAGPAGDRSSTADVFDARVGGTRAAAARAS